MWTAQYVCPTELTSLVAGKVAVCTVPSAHAGMSYRRVQNLVSHVWTRCIYMLIDLNRHILAALDRMEASCDIDMS